MLDQFVEAGKDPAIPFNLVNETLDQMELFVKNISLASER